MAGGTVEGPVVGRSRRVDEEREKRTKEWLSDQMRRAIALRSKDRDFHGLDREFLIVAGAPRNGIKT
jgi:hypothetical protein